MYAKDLERIAEFYTALGLKVDESQPGDYAVLTGPELELSIVQIPQAMASRIEISNPPQARESAPIKLAFVVSSIDETLEAARLLGGRIQDGSKRWRFRGHAIQDAIDPEGNVYQLREPL
jgi:catechol 2,3-dioxygenase-like lactoylglutathione lyase family enzyme